MWQLRQEICEKDYLSPIYHKSFGNSDLAFVQKISKLTPTMSLNSMLGQVQRYVYSTHGVHRCRVVRIPYSTLFQNLKTPKHRQKYDKLIILVAFYVNALQYMWKHFTGTKETTANVKKNSYRRPEADETQLGRCDSSISSRGESRRTMASWSMHHWYRINQGLNWAGINVPPNTL